jgi:hypothetical protein
MTSPWGRGDNYSIIPWNLMMIGLTYSLFWRERRSLHASPIPPLSMKRLIYFALCIVLPALGYLGLWNSYLSFSVYSGQGAVGFAFERPEGGTSNFPEAAQRVSYISDDGLREVTFDRWANAVMYSPPSPEDTSIVEIANYLCRNATLADKQLIIVIRSSSLPWERTHREEGYICKGGLLTKPEDLRPSQR